LGRVRPSLVKSIGKRLVERYPDAFGNEFDENKESVEEYAEVRSKHLRNRIAGYITHLQGIDQTED